MAKRILLISSNSSGRGGGERYLVYLTRGLRDLGVDTHVLLSNAAYMAGWARDLAGEGAIVHRRPLVGLRDRPLRFVQALTDRKQQQLVASVCRELAPDAILVNQQYDEDGLDYLKGALQARVAPVGGTMHMPMTRHKHDRPLGRARGAILRRWYRSNPYALLLVSRGSQKEFEAYYDCPRPTHLVNYGCVIPAPAFLHRRPASDGRDEPVVAFAGQLVAQKNLSLLVDAWLFARRQGARSRLLLVGDGPERADLERRLSLAAPPGEWEITGWTPEPEARLAAADLYVMTSHFEGLPLALVEAAGMGLPAVVTPFNGASDVAARAPWVRVAEATVEDVGTAIVQSLGDRSALGTRAAAGVPAFRDYFSPERMAGETLSALNIQP